VDTRASSGESRCTKIVFRGRDTGWERYSAITTGCRMSENSRSPATSTLCAAMRAAALATQDSGVVVATKSGLDCSDQSMSKRLWPVIELRAGSRATYLSVLPSMSTLLNREKYGRQPAAKTATRDSGSAC